MSITDKEALNFRTIPLSDFFRNPEKTHFLISPNGKFVSFLAPYNERLNIFVQETGTGTTRRITEVTERDIYNYFWGNDKTIIYLRDNAGDENYHFFSVNIESGMNRDLTPFEGVRANLVDKLEDFDSEILIEMNKRNSEVFDVYRLNIETSEMKIAAENPGNISGWVTDHEGKIRAALTTDGVNNSLLFRETEKDEWRIIITTDFKESIVPLFFTFDNSYLYASSNIGRDKSAIIKYDIKNAKELEVIFEHPDVDVYYMSYSRKRKVLTAISYDTWKRERFFLDEQTKQIYEKLQSMLGKYEISVADKDDNEEKYIIRTYSDRSLGANYLYDKNADLLTKISDVSPWINEDEMSEMKPVTYNSRDGLTINGYLSLPPGKEHKHLPVVINPHGGPWARDYWGFNPEIQFLVNRGYAVLQMNFRGSVGFGRKFWECSFKQWGRTMQNDISDGVNWLIDQGIADPKRIAIYGGSYGGYAVLAGLVYTPDLYAAGVDYVGVSNLFTFMNSIPSYWKPYLETLYEMVGHPEKDKELLEESSPVFHVDKIKAPLFIAQGKMDPRVNINESDQMVEALKKRGIDVPYMVKDNEGHGFQNQENKFDFYREMEIFLGKHLKI
ncbi:MAG TPA: S9 family peptidase [Ignavibacteria bacterium]|nr:S9 family peptidase [Ignavibacteria bacterium]